MVSVLIPTLNEARNIRDCLASVAWCDEVVLVDSSSDDGTPDYARAAGARIVNFEWNHRFPKKKNWALENVSLKNEWVLILDADERIAPELATEIQTVLKAPDADGYFLNRRFMFMGRWIRHCGYYPSWNLRLFKHRLGRYEMLHGGDSGSGDNEVHEHIVLNGPTAHLQNDMLHYAYPDIYTWVEKHNRYSNWEADVEVNGSDHDDGGPAIGETLQGRRRLRTWSRRLPFRPTLRFLYSYVFHCGFLDGSEGYAFCRLLAMYEYMIVVKVKALERRAAARPK